MNNENDYTKSTGFGYDQSGLKPDDCNLLNSTISGYLAGYLRARGDSGRVSSHGIMGTSMCSTSTSIPWV